jgi:capsular polysaccharide export protein
MKQPRITQDARLARRDDRQRMTRLEEIRDRQSMGIGPGVRAQPAPQYSRVADMAYSALRHVLQLPPWIERSWPLCAPLEKPLGHDPHDASNAESIARATRALRIVVEQGAGGAWWGGKPILPGATLERLFLVGGSPEQLPHGAEAGIPSDGGMDRVVVLLAADADRSWRRVLADWRRRGAIILSGHIDPWPLLANCKLVHVVGDQATSILALIAGRTVIGLDPGMLAALDLTPEVARYDCVERDRALASAFATHAIDGALYREPYRGTPCSLEEALDLVCLLKRKDLDNRGIAACIGMSFWKRARIASFLRSAEGVPAFVRDAAKAVAIARERGGGVAVWASREPGALAEKAASAGVPVLRIEDGFIRSAGLGADFVPPASITIDGSGLYFDPSRPSDLELILDSIELDPSQRARARRLIELIVSHNITKYAGDAPSAVARHGQRAILVPGQVEDDRSVLAGGAGIRTNLELLRRVRAAAPDARILYKPHPDVEAGHRAGAVPEGDALQFADEIVRGGIASLIMRADELHCLTSLAGFEALLRGKPVTVHGQPFYAGWGLTTDLAPIPRRRRRLDLEELVAGVLIAYPRYIDPRTGIPCGPEVLISRFAESDLWRPTLLVRLRRLQGQIMAALRSASPSR